jgi:hypothetical protein
MRALDVIDERRRPRQSNFGSLGAGMVARGTVPAELLADAADADEAAPAALLQRPSIVAQANRRHAERMARATRTPQDAALLQAERTRPRESTFASLTGSMVERGKLPRDILTAAQIERLLLGEPVDTQPLLPSLGEPAHATDVNAVSDAALPADIFDDAAEDAMALAWAPSASPDVAADHSVGALSEPPLLRDLPLPASLYVVRPTEPVEPPVSDASVVPPTWRRSAGAWAAMLAVLVVTGFLPSGTWRPSIPAPATLDVVPAVEAEEPDQAAPVAAQPAMAPPEAVETVAAELPGDDDAAAPVAPVEIKRWRPGAAQEQMPAAAND